MEYRVTRLLEPELGMAERASPRSWSRRRGWLTPWIGLGLLILVPGLLSGSRRAAVAAASTDPGTVEFREEFPVDEWIRLVGVAPARPIADVPPPRPQWSILLPDSEEASGAQQLLAGNAESLSIGGLPVSLARLVQMYAGANSQLELAAAGGEVQLVGGDLPPWMWGDVRLGADAPLARSVRVTLPPMLDGQARISGLSAWVEGINYSDPNRVGLPLLRTGGFGDHRLSEHFFVRDFATHDGAPFARIAIDLVAGLESLRRQIGPVMVISGYRHPRYNASPAVGGARYSRHQSGQAADVHSQTATSLEIAHAAIQTMGCGIGLGLGRNTVHIDVRGYLSTWTYPGAPLSESVFERWILALCGGSAPQAPRLEHRMTNEDWLALVAEGAQDESEVVHLTEASVEEAVEEASEDAAVAAAQVSVDHFVQRDLAEFAQASFDREGHGVVVVDLRDGAVLEGRALLARARYVRATLPELRWMHLDGLLQLARDRPAGAYFVYAIRLPNNEVRSALASTASLEAVPAPHMTQSQTVPPTAPAPPRSPSGSEASPAARWHLLLPPSASLDEVDRDVVYYQTLLAATNYQVAPHLDGRGEHVRYRVSIGTFASRAEADAAKERLRLFIGGEVEVIELGL